MVLHMVLGFYRKDQEVIDKMPKRGYSIILFLITLQGSRDN